MIIFIALSIAANQASLNEALEKYRNLQTEINPLNDFSKLKDKIAKVDLLINCDFIKKNKESFMAFYLKKIKHDLDILNNMSDSEKSEFSLIYKDFFSYLFFLFIY